MITPKKKVRYETNEYISPQQYKLFRTTIHQKDELYRIFYDFMYFLGLRPEEVRHIKIEDIDLNEKSIQYITAKTYIYDKKPLPQPFFNELNLFLERNRFRFREGFLFTGYNGQQMKTNSLRRKFRHYCKLVGWTKFHSIDTNIHLKNAGRKLYNIRLYSLRHSFFTNTLAITRDIVKTSKIGNHTSVDTTFRHYIDLDLRSETEFVLQTINDRVTI